MTTTFKRKAANAALAGVVALGCAGAATTTALVSAATDATVAHADEWKYSKGSWWYQTGKSYAKGWKQIGGTWYYFDNNGWMQTGWQKLGGAWYYLKSSGAMASGWNKVSGTWYYHTSSGAMKTGWNKVGSTWYYHNDSGAMVTGWQSIGGKWYYFNGSGAMQAGRWIGDYYVMGDGAVATNQWIGQYWVDATGKWLPGVDATNINNVVAIYDKEAGIPPLIDNGYANEPRLIKDPYYDYVQNAGANGAIGGGPWVHEYGSWIEEPFNVDAGQSMTIGKVGETGAYCRIYFGSGTVLRIVKKDEAGNVKADYEITADPMHTEENNLPDYGFRDDIPGYRYDDRYFQDDYWDETEIWQIEVYSGQVTVYTIEAKDAPSIEFGSCKTVAYPYSISATSLSMKIGQEYKLTAKCTCSWNANNVYVSSNENVVQVDRETGEVKAVGKGNAEITVFEGSPEFGWNRRLCKVTVS